MANRLLLDTNLCVLFFVGLTKRAYIGKHKRLRDVYFEEDYEILLNLIEASSGVVFSPNVLSETSNLMRYIDDPARSEISKLFAEVIGRGEELYVASRVASARPEHLRLGLTDAVLLTLSSDGAVLLTADLDLYLAALHAGFEAINYNHIRDARLG